MRVHRYFADLHSCTSCRTPLTAKKTVSTRERDCQHPVIWGIRASRRCPWIASICRFFRSHTRGSLSRHCGDTIIGLRVCVVIAYWERLTSGSRRRTTAGATHHSPRWCRRRQCTCLHCFLRVAVLYRCVKPEKILQPALVSRSRMKYLIEWWCANDGWYKAKSSSARRRRSRWCRLGIRQVRRCAGCTVCIEGTHRTVVFRATYHCDGAEWGRSEPPPLDMIFSLHPDAPSSLLKFLSRAIIVFIVALVPTGAWWCDMHSKIT